MQNKRVLIVGSARESGGGVASVIRLMEKMPMWSMFKCRWLGTQIQKNYLWKIWYALKGNIIALFIIWRYDIIHFHTTPDKTGLMIQLPILILARLWRKKVILHVHMGNQLKDHTNNKLFIWCLLHADIVVLLAKKWKDMFTELFPQVDKRVEVIYNACESLPDIPLSTKTKTIILMAHMIEDKGIDVMIKAWKLINKDYQDWHVFMMGDGEYLRYQKMASEMGLSNSMTFTGYVTGKEREGLLKNASISVMCSYNEGFPMVVLEGWSYKHAVITTPVGGLPDVIEDGKNCLVFDFGNYEMLASHLKNLMDDDNLRHNIASYSKTFGENIFSLQKVSVSLSNLYESL